VISSIRCHGPTRFGGGAPRIHGELLKLGNEDQPDHCLEIHGSTPEASISKLANFSNEPCQGYHPGRFLHGSIGNVPRALRLHHSVEPASTGRSFQRDGYAVGNLDRTADCGSVPLGYCSEVPTPGSRRKVWKRSRSAGLVD
jgi:hypothetical protein